MPWFFYARSEDSDQTRKVPRLSLSCAYRLYACLCHSVAHMLLLHFLAIFSCSLYTKLGEDFGARIHNVKNPM